MSRVIAVMFNKSCGQIINVGSDFRNYYAYFKKRRRNYKKITQHQQLKFLLQLMRWSLEEGFFKFEIKLLSNLLVHTEVIRCQNLKIFND